MKIFFNTNQNNIHFNGRTPYSQSFLDRTLKPYVESNIPIKAIQLETKLSRNTISNWIKNTYNMTAGQLYRIKRNEQREKDVAMLLFQKKSPKQIADILCLSQGIVFNILKNPNIKKILETISKTQDEQIIEGVYAGDSLRQIGEKNGLSINKTMRKIKTLLNNNITNVRKNNGIHISSYKQALVEDIKNLNNQGWSTKEIASKVNRSRSRIFYLMREFNIIPSRKLTEKEFDENIQKYLEQNMELKEIAQLHKMSPKAASRRIKQLYGKSYKQVKKEFRLKRLQDIKNNKLLEGTK